MEDSARLTNLSCPSVDFEPGPIGLGPIGLAKRGFDGAGALASLVRLGLPLETAGWRLRRGHHAGGSR